MNKMNDLVFKKKRCNVKECYNTASTVGKCPGHFQQVLDEYGANHPKIKNKNYQKGTFFSRNTDETIL